MIESGLNLYDIVRQRIKRFLEINVPSFLSIDELDISKTRNFLENIFDKTNQNDGFSADKKSLFEHLEIMEDYFEELMKYHDFSDLATRIFPKKTEDYLRLLVYLHDFSRFIFNGPLPLVYVDWVSGGLLKKRVLDKMFPNNPELVTKILNCFHSIDWITGKKHLPENDNELTDEQKMGLILKAIDTLGKKEKNGNLRDPDIFFAQEGGYNQWLKFQIDNHRFPLKIGPNQFIDAQTYAKNDIALTRRGIALIERLTNEKFGNIREKLN